MTQAEIIQKIISAAQSAGIDPTIGVEQARQESAFRTNAVSHAGAQGLFQFMPGTWATYGSGSPFDPDAAIAAWVRYMTKLLNQFGGRYDLALAGYNWGENRAILRNALANNTSLPLNRIPAETSNYVQRILSKAGKPINFRQAPKATTRKPSVPKS